MLELLASLLVEPAAVGEIGRRAPDADIALPEEPREVPPGIFGIDVADVTGNGTRVGVPCPDGIARTVGPGFDASIGWARLAPSPFQAADLAPAPISLAGAHGTNGVLQFELEINQRHLGDHA